MNLKQGRYYEKIEQGRVHCFLCPHNCIIRPGKTGVCRVRKNMEGKLYALNYNKVTSIALDPIEKKPLKRFYPGSRILSAGTFGCNLKCSFCQNWTIAHETPGTMTAEPEELAAKAKELESEGSIGIAYTYNEPFIWYEYVYDCCRIAKRLGLKNVLVTNGFVSKRPLEDILPYIDAMNIDVKAFTESFYKDICKAVLSNVKETVETAVPKCHVEVTTLLVPGLNDSTEEIEKLAGWLSTVSKDIILHLTRFFPNYRMNDKPPTPVKTLENARKIALKYLNYVYLGNI